MLLSQIHKTEVMAAGLLLISNPFLRLHKRAMHMPITESETMVFGHQMLVLSFRRDEVLRGVTHNCDRAKTKAFSPDFLR